MSASKAYFLLGAILAISAIVSSPSHHLLLAEVEVETEGRGEEFFKGEEYL